MKRFREKHPLLASLIILAVMFAGLPAGNVLVGIAAAVPPLTEFLGDYGIQLLAELSMLVVMVLMTFLWKMERVFTCRGRGFGQSLLPAAPLLALYAIAGVESLMFGLEGLMLGDGSPLQNPLHILLFVEAHKYFPIRIYQNLKHICLRNLNFRYGSRSVDLHRFFLHKC